MIVNANKEQEKDREKFLDKATGQEMDTVGEPQSLLEWLAEKYTDFGAQLEVRDVLAVETKVSSLTTQFVTNKSQEGAQFVKGFGGIGGLLRYKLDLDNLAAYDDESDEFLSDDDDAYV